MPASKSFSVFSGGHFEMISEQRRGISNLRLFLTFSRVETFSGQLKQPRRFLIHECNMHCRSLVQIFRCNDTIKIEIGDYPAIENGNIGIIALGKFKVLRTGCGILPLGFGRQTKFPVRIFFSEPGAIGQGIVIGYFHNRMIFFPPGKCAVSPITW